MDYFKPTMKIINNAVDSIQDEEFSRLLHDCLEVLSKGGKIIATGLGKNVPICEKFVGTLSSVGISAAFMHTNSAVHGDLGIVKDDDLVIILTKSGETVESVYLYGLLKKRGCMIWLLSFNRESALYKDIPRHLVIELEHEGDEWDILPNNSTLLNLIVLQELAMQIIKEQHIDIDALRENHPGGAIGVRLSTGL